MNVTLATLAEVTRQTPFALRQRVPFGDTWLAKTADISRKTLLKKLGNPAERAGDEADRKLAKLLFRWVYEGSVEAETLPRTYLFHTAAVDETDNGERLSITCPACSYEYMLGSVQPFLVVDTDRDDRKLIFYHGRFVQCPKAQEGSCASPKEDWQPRLVELVYRTGPGVALDRLLLSEVPHVRQP